MNKDWFFASSMFMSSAATVTIQLGLNYTTQESAGAGIFFAVLALVCYIKSLEGRKNESL